MDPSAVELIAVGSELLGLGRRDTNGDWLQARLMSQGLEVVARAVVADRDGPLSDVLRSAIERSAVVILTGGLGPTEDDRTREAVSQALGLPLEDDLEQLALLQRRLDRYGHRLTEMQARQASRPRGARWLPNPLGSAPGFELHRGKRRVFALPGVPSEMKAMFDAHVAPALAPGRRPAVVVRSTRTCGRPESRVDSALADLAFPGELTLLSGAEGVEVHVVVRGKDRANAEAEASRVEDELRLRLGADVVGPLDRSLAQTVGGLLDASSKTLATAESCTGGLLGGAVTAVAGSSAWYRGGVVVYTSDLKQKLVGVSAQSLARHGAVSEAVARELACGVARTCTADFGIGITGIAGPGGGSIDKPVGRVHLAIASASEVRHWRLDLHGDREGIRSRAVTQALDRLRRWLLEPAAD